MRLLKAMDTDGQWYTAAEWNKKLPGRTPTASVEVQDYDWQLHPGKPGLFIPPVTIDVQQAFGKASTMVDSDLDEIETYVLKKFKYFKRGDKDIQKVGESFTTSSGTEFRITEIEAIGLKSITEIRIAVAEVPKREPPLADINFTLGDSQYWTRASEDKDGNVISEKPPWKNKL